MTEEVKNEESEEIKLDDIQVPVSDTFSITHENRTIELKMTFFNLSRLTQLVALDYERFILGFIDPGMQEKIITAIFAENDKEKGEVVLSSERKAFVADLTPDEANDIYSWCEAHITNFFMKRLYQRKSLNEKNEKVMQARVNLFKQLGLTEKKNNEKEN